MTRKKLKPADIKKKKIYNLLVLKHHPPPILLNNEKHECSELMWQKTESQV